MARAILSYIDASAPPSEPPDKRPLVSEHALIHLGEGGEVTRLGAQMVARVAFALPVVHFAEHCMHVFRPLIKLDLCGEDGLDDILRTARVGHVRGGARLVEHHPPKHLGRVQQCHVHVDPAEAPHLSHLGEGDEVGSCMPAQPRQRVLRHA